MKISFRMAREGSHIPNPYPRVSSFFERKERNTQHQFLCLKDTRSNQKFPWGFQVIIIRRSLPLVSRDCEASRLPGREGVLDFLLDFCFTKRWNADFCDTVQQPHHHPFCCFVSWGRVSRRFFEFLLGIKEICKVTLSSPCQKSTLAFNGVCWVM
jgi:hypothetical protein